ncbi:hypothetical protein MSG28_005642 [Choristoneura fumiferana]|uniref:Uncharacterized protein n=1 Tax=Choristoneura fumiferana TaxID=7141 RepID=A0ACC0L093_CHOFU|nr:hypothetical protein MSG28_005642 [Choristoneura fumiferana]
MASLRFVLVFALCSFYGGTRAEDTSEGLTIIGGHNVSITDAPYMAALYSKGKFVCGGTIIHDMFVLTSAHCVRNSIKPRKVIIGADRLKADDDKVVIGVKEEFCHENYHPDPETNDICLLKLYKPIPFGPKIAKVDLPSQDFQIPGGLLVNVTGWGITSPSSQRIRAKKLQQVTIVTVSESECLRYYPDLTDNLICAGSKGRDACRGDDGGPLTLYDTQIGVVSYEKGCGRVAGVYTKVSSYITWIKNTIEANL